METENLHRPGLRPPPNLAQCDIHERRPPFERPSGELQYATPACDVAKIWNPGQQRDEVAAIIAAQGLETS
jgi:hypothetical protein